VRWPLMAWVDFFRAFPPLVLLIFLFAGLPFAGLELGGFACVCIAFFLNTGAYYGEILRAGIESVPSGQVEAVRRARRQAHRGSLKIEAMAAGQIVPAFEVLDATHKKVLDGGMAWSTTGSARTRPRRCSPARRAARSAWTTSITSAGCDGGGNELWTSSTRRSSSSTSWLPIAPVEPAGVRLVQAADQEPRRLQGHEVPPDRHQRRDLPAHGHDDGQHARRRDRARRRSAA
jgi:hypothetical protein